MPLDVLGCTRATMGGTATQHSLWVVSLFQLLPCLGQCLEIVALEPGIPSKCESSTRAD